MELPAAYEDPVPLLCQTLSVVNVEQDRPVIRKSKTLAIRDISYCN